MGKSELTGPWGELQAVDYLRRKKYAILGCNYRTRFGEIDIIAQDRSYVIFVEVKLRKSDRFGEAREFVNHDKQERIKTTAAQWLQENPNRRQPRFDVIEIYAPEGAATRNPKIIHLEDAFQ